MNDDTDLNEHGNHQGEFRQSVGGWAEYTVNMTEIIDTIRHDVTIPPRKIIPIIFLPGVMGSNLRMTKKRQDDLKRPDNRSWRPDDMVDKSGNLAVATGSGLGGWFRSASPRDRQLAFDPNETEVEYYQYSIENERFFPGGDITKGSDVRHNNVPDDFLGVPPLISVSTKKNAQVDSIQKPGVMGRFIPREVRETPAHIARWRGWSEVLFAGAYGEMLQKTEFFMNNITRKGQVLPHWKIDPSDQQTGRYSFGQQAYPPIAKLLIKYPKEFGGSSGVPINNSDMLKIAPCWYPVHALGYNFLQSNAISSTVIAERIRGIVKGYQKCGFKCGEVILVTHSMGGLLARSLMHPRYGNMLNDKDIKILGIYHNVMPTLGAASAYKRMRFGFQEKSGPLNTLAAQVLAIDGEHATAILANTPAPLEMMPGMAYGQEWLKVVDASDKLLWSWPRDKESALEGIYLQPANAWWRLINPSWVNPANIPLNKGGGIDNVMQRLKDASALLKEIEKIFHPNTYASYCASKEFLSYGEITFKVIEGFEIKKSANQENTTPPPNKWRLLTDDAKGNLTIQAGTRVLKLKLQPANSAGDETVPSDRSAKHIPGKKFVHGEKAGTGYEHQNSYTHPHVLASMLYSIVQIAKTAKWE
ncbi:esterase/lipase family protein [Janthinobacterium sp. HLS12-2]|uniref:esterase/lipase family protein n=1 Tax=Janthinobacterium sp. HLS12-2 TaxID=1259324 RepID=UPI003F297AFF